MLATSAEELSAIVTVLMLLVYVFMANRVGRWRAKYNIQAPATTGHPLFERAFRVHGNTVEQMFMFLPLLWLATYFFRGPVWLPAAFGLVFVVGRILFMQGYMKDPEKRLPGIMVGMLALLGLLILTIIGLVQNWSAVP
ncbi:MAG: MAPEG family protein [Rhizomicrobium sp.]|jgi:glutathione S-transferase